MEKKVVILSFIGHYLPGYKAGGILRSMANMTEILSKDIKFKIITRDRDLGDEHSYTNIKLNSWNKIVNTDVYYLDPKKISYKYVSKLIKTTSYDYILLNSFFETLSFFALINNKLFSNKNQIILAPRGEFSPAALNVKFYKKILYITILKRLGILNKITFLFSTEFEKHDFEKYIPLKNLKFKILADLPKYMCPYNLDIVNKSLNTDLQIIFLSRISPEKNLKYVLEILFKVKRKVILDIYGPIENYDYWDQCLIKSAKLPANITFNYNGEIHPNETALLFANYDLFILPTLGENYGHVIVESWMAGKPVLISNNTPWLELSKLKLGWEFPLDDINNFIEVIESFNKKDFNPLAIRKTCEDKIQLNQLKKSYLEFFKSDFNLNKT